MEGYSCKKPNRKRKTREYLEGMYTTGMVCVKDSSMESVRREK